MAQSSRSTLPLPSRWHVSVIAYDVKDPDPQFPAMETLLPPDSVTAEIVVPAGAHELRLEFGHDSNRGDGTPSLFIDGVAAENARVEARTDREQAAHRSFTTTGRR